MYKKTNYILKKKTKKRLKQKDSRLFLLWIKLLI